jgi:hypothetical protein
MSFIKSAFRKSFVLMELRRFIGSMIDLRDLSLHLQTIQLQESHPNPLNKYGGKGFSQTDEDGITIEIIKRLKLDRGTYAEFGVGNGMENNTLILAAMGWRGFWVGGEELGFETPPSSRFTYLKSWITRENILDLTRAGMSKINATQLDVVSLDLDGNDIHFVRELLSHDVHPKLFIVEYNAQFPPPAKFEIDYDPKHVWKSDNYFGAALQNFNELFETHGYSLVCCNSHTGANAFFVKRSFMEEFSEVPKDLSKVFVYPRYKTYHRYGHKQSARVVQKLLGD